MKHSMIALSIAAAFAILGCGGGGGNSSGTLTDIRVSDGYVVNAVVTSGDLEATEIPSQGAGWYRIKQDITENIIVTKGVNDILHVNGIPDSGEPYVPSMEAPANYKNVNPFTTLMFFFSDEEMQDEFPKAHDYDATFNFDVVKASQADLDIAKETARAAMALSIYENSPQNVINLRIINGSKVPSNDSTWQFIVAVNTNQGLSCGGSLIAPQWVLTAAHCTEGFPKIKNVTSGSYSLTIGGQNIIVDQQIPHPEYDSFTVDNDIALLRLAQPVTSVSAISLYRGNALNSGVMTQVAGWGNTEIDGANYPNDLMEVNLPVIDFNICNNSYQNDGTFLTQNMFCAGYMDGHKDSCQGDSGGPLIVEQLPGEFQLAGVVSFGGSTEQACGAPNYPGVYTRVNNYIEWIEGHTGPLDGSSSSSSITSSSSSSSSSSSESSSSSSTTSSSSSSSSESSSSFQSSSSSSSLLTYEEIAELIDNANSLEEINSLIIEHMGAYNGVYEE